MKAKLLAAACLAAALPLRAGTLDMDGYLAQVRQGNEQLRSDKALDAAYALQAKQPLTAFSPQLTAQVSHDNDESMPVLPDFSPSSTKSTQWGASLSQFYGSGTNVSLGYAGDYTQLGFPAALSAQLGPLPATYGEQLTLTVSQSLWRNFMASSVQADLALAQASSEGQRAGNRYAAQAALRASDAIVRQVTESFTPDLSVFASFGVNQREGSAGSAFDDSLTGDHKTTMVGLKLTANLDLPLYRQVLAGAQGAKGSGEAQVAGKRREIEKDWEQLRQGWNGMQDRLVLAQQLESLQKEKADREKVRYQDGRTTNFQVLRFEDDYNLSRVQTLQLTALANVLAATARFYNAEDQPW